MLYYCAHVVSARDCKQLTSSLIECLIKVYEDDADICVTSSSVCRVDAEVLLLHKTHFWRTSYVGPAHSVSTVFMSENHKEVQYSMNFVRFEGCTLLTLKVTVSDMTP
jgi:hypothetical protein